MVKLMEGRCGGGPLSGGEGGWGTLGQSGSSTAWLSLSAVGYSWLGGWCSSPSQPVSREHSRYIIMRMVMVMADSSQARTHADIKSGLTGITDVTDSTRKQCRGISFGW